MIVEANAGEITVSCLEFVRNVTARITSALLIESFSNVYSFLYVVLHMMSKSFVVGMNW